MARVLTLFAFGLLISCCLVATAAAGSASSTTESYFVFDDAPTSSVASKRTNKKPGRNRGGSTPAYRALPSTSTAIYDQESHSSADGADADSVFDVDAVTSDNDNNARGTSAARYYLVVVFVTVGSSQTAFRTRLSAVIKRTRRVVPSETPFVARERDFSPAIYPHSTTGHALRGGQRAASIQFAKAVEEI